MSTIYLKKKQLENIDRGRLKFKTSTGHLASSVSVVSIETRQIHTTNVETQFLLMKDSLNLSSFVLSWFVDNDIDEYHNFSKSLFGLPKSSV